MTRRAFIIEPDRTDLPVDSQIAADAAAAGSSYAAMGHLRPDDTFTVRARHGDEHRRYTFDPRRDSLIREEHP